MRNRWATQPRFNDQECGLATWPTITVVHTKARGHDLPLQSGLAGISSGQHGMSPDISMPDMPCIAGPEAAITLSAAPMLKGPTTIPSRVVTNSSRWMTFMNLTRIVWHEDIGVGRGLTEKCVIDSDALRACSGYVSICSHVSSRDSRDSAGCNFLAWFGFHSCYGGLSCVTNICRLSRRSE